MRRPPHRDRHAWWLLAVLLGGAALTLPAATGRGSRGPLDLSGLEGSAKLTALLDEVVARQRALRSLRAEFVQVKRSSLLREPVRSSGELAYLAPNRVRWDYRQPEAMVVLYADHSVTTYHPVERRAQRVEVSRRDLRFVRALAGTLPLDDLTSYFKIRLEDPGPPRPFRLRLVPHRESLARQLESLVVEVDRELLLPVVVEYNEADGDTTRYEFGRMELDPDLEVSRFQLELEDGVVLEQSGVVAGLG